MIKVLPPNGYDFGMPIASLIDVHRGGIDSAWMVKRAMKLAMFDREVAALRPQPGHAYIHLNSMGAQEAYGSNRNGDGFNEKAGSFELVEPKAGLSKIVKMAGGLMDHHRTFRKGAFVYKHHQNNDPLKKIGHIYAEAYNPEMRRGELIIDVPITKQAQQEMGTIDHPWEEKVAKLADGKDIPFSMACKVAYDICTYCGNQAAHRGQYCDHLKNHMSEITKSGHQIFAINDAPGFFDISDVFRPADRIAYSLRKVAGDAAVGGAALAEELGLVLPNHWITGNSAYAQTKLAIANKLADIEKQVDAVAAGKNNSHIKSLISAAQHGTIPSDAMEVLRSTKLSTALGALAEEGIVLGAADFLRLVTGAPQKCASVAGDAAVVTEALPGMYNRLLASGEIEECVTDTAYDPSFTAIPRHVKDAVWRLTKDHSSHAECAEKRAQAAIVRGTTQTLNTRTTKQAAVYAPSSLLAKEYAKYQLSCLIKAAGNQLAQGLTVLRNYTA